MRGRRSTLRYVAQDAFVRRLLAYTIPDQEGYPDWVHSQDEFVVVKSKGGLSIPRTEWLSVRIEKFGLIKTYESSAERVEALMEDAFLLTLDVRSKGYKIVRPLVVENFTETHWWSYRVTVPRRPPRRLPRHISCAGSRRRTK